MVKTDYGKYKEARNASWQCILDYGIKALPVTVTNIIEQTDSVRLFKNTDVNILRHGESGKTFFHDDKFEIVYNNTEPSTRCRFTIAHELGHIFLGHLIINKTAYRTFQLSDENESSANVFARDLLAPACVLHELHALQAADIARLCNISLEAAAYREARMKELEQRNAWYKHPLEREVYKQFEDFIKCKTAE